MTPPSDEQIKAKWQEIASLAEKVTDRSGTQGGFSTSPGSPFAGDDASSAPYQVSHAAKVGITTAADHLHGLCALVLKSGFLHWASPASLARGALECAAAATWIASPTTRNERITRALQWNIKDAQDNNSAATTAGLPVPTALQDRKAKIEAMAATRSLDFKKIRVGYTSTEAVKAAEEYLKPPLGALLPWQLASGFAHGRRWAVVAFAEIIEKDTAAEPGVVNLKMVNDNVRVLYLALAAATIVQGAVTLYDQRATAP